VLLGTTAKKLQDVGVQTLAIVASKAERARVFFRFRPVSCPVGADPDLITHRAYGNLARELQIQVPESQARDAVDRLDGFEVTESEKAEFQRHQIQFTGQFLVDRDGIVRWTNIECARDGLASIDKFPTDEELLAAAQALSK
jgi:hypothetical protein